MINYRGMETIHIIFIRNTNLLNDFTDNIYKKNVTIKSNTVFESSYSPTLDHKLHSGMLSDLFLSTIKNMINFNTTTTNLIYTIQNIE